MRLVWRGAGQALATGAVVSWGSLTLITEVGTKLSVEAVVKKD